MDVIVLKQMLTWIVYQVFGSKSLVQLEYMVVIVTLPTGSEISGYIGDTETFTPELASTFTNIFTAVFGRRLGTIPQMAQH